MTQLLERFTEPFARSDVHAAMRSLVDVLYESRRSCPSAQQWRQQVLRLREEAPVQIAYACPFTRHAFEKPSGYPGDARLIDHIYGYAPQPVDTLGRLIYGFTTSSPASRSVRLRRSVLAHEIDAVMHRRGEQARILAVACGHLREVEWCASMRRITPARFVALDQDEQSLALVGAEYGHLGIECRNINVKDIVRGKVDLGDFDLIYAAGLYDYLPDEFASRLTDRLFERLLPGGTFMAANFLPDAPDVGYMEAVMDWWLVYREAGDLRKLANGVAAELIADTSYFEYPDSDVAFLRVRRK